MGNCTSSSSCFRIETADEFQSFGRHARSIECETEVFVDFMNATNNPVTLYWLNYEGRKEKYHVIAPGETIEQHTFLTHPWTFEIKKKKKKKKKNNNNNDSHSKDYAEEEYEEKYGDIVVADDCRRVIFPDESRDDSVGSGAMTTRVVLKKPSLCKWSTENHGRYFPRTFVDSTTAFLLCHHVLRTRSTKRIRFKNCSNSRSNSGKIKDKKKNKAGKGQQQLYDDKNGKSSKITSTTSTSSNSNNSNSNCNKNLRNPNGGDENKYKEGEEDATAIGLGDLPAELILKVIELSAPRVPFVLPLEPQQ